MTDPNWDLQQRMALKLRDTQNQTKPPFLGMDSFHLLSWMNTPIPEAPEVNNSRPADVLIQEVWDAAWKEAIYVITNFKE